MRNIFISILIMFSASGLFGQSNNIIQGTVVDQATGEVLVGVTITHVPTGEKFTTDFDGNFKIEEPVSGVNQLRVSYVSYEDAELKKVIVKKGESINLNIKLRKQGGKAAPKDFLANDAHVVLIRS